MPVSRLSPSRAVLLLLLGAACQRPVPVAAPSPAGGPDSAVAADSSGTAARPVGRPEINRAEASEWKGRQVARVEELLVGRFPGVQVYQTAQGLTARMRGQTSILGSNEPLFVIDGMPIEAGPGGLLAINPQDIASIEVLKDPSSTSVYGMRGANGVVVITTKRGP